MISKRGFVILGRWEAVSLLVLLCVAMPLKYVWGYPVGVRVVGSAHGFLFLGYVFAALSIAQHDRWGWMKLARCLIASCLPCGTFFFERELRASA